MKLRFEVDQAESFRRGVDCPKSIVTVEVNPAELPKHQRQLVGERLKGIDVMKMRSVYTSIGDKGWEWTGAVEIDETRIVASTPTWEGLLESIDAENQSLNDSPNRKAFF